VLDREEPTKSWYLDLSLLEGYWGDERSYHHTAPITNVYALREALRLVAEEGIEARWERHREVAGELTSGLQDLGLEMNAADEYWLPSLNAVQVPDGVDDAAVIDHLLAEYDIEIAAGLGDLAGDVWRIGCMGYSARPKNVQYALSALDDALAAQGHEA
ncbi:alanine--glyoxylate aminotransferase family protein, partial [Halorubrum sp. SD626R]|uniref:aminotransferase class V-fold PLP-dependent enzyme n=1 Tax=Halorubrum sp. SD626R TaxID=1419722 RepID=UPI0010F80FCE